MIRRPPRSTQSRSSAASDVYKRQEERTPDESTLRKTRQRMPIDVFDRVFSQVLDVCQSRGLLKGRAIGIDSTQIDANASMDSLKHKELGCTYEEYMLAVRRQDMPDATK